MKHHLLYWCGLVTICAAGLFACPSVQTIVLNIDGVEVKDGSLRGQSFDLRIYGQGFGVDKIAYDLSKQTGQAEKPEYQLRIVDQAGSILAFSEGSQIQVVSTTLMNVNFILQTPLEYGEYDLELTVKGRNGDPLDTLRNGIVVMSDEVPDAGMMVRPPMDTGVAVDTGVGIPPDAGVDGSVIEEDAGQGNNLGDWRGNYRYRREVVVSNPSGDVAPGGMTLRIPIPHGDHVLAGQAESDASDVAIYLNSQELPFQWENRAIVNRTDQTGQNELVMIAQIPETQPIPTGLFREAVIVLYFGDDTATPNQSDSVFTFSERFDQNLNNWEINQWARTCPDRFGGPQGSYCVGDSASNPHKRTLASPAANILSVNPANVVYELGFWFAGSMAGAQDLVYFAYGANSTNFSDTTVLMPLEYTENPPLDVLAFVEDDPAVPRIVRGWKFPSGRGQTWAVSRARFTPNVDNPSFHFRFISADGTNAPMQETNVALEDFTVRKALEPDFEVTLGPVESLR